MATCPRCGHSESDHWYPGTEAITTACVSCLGEQFVTTWGASDDVSWARTGICDHTAEWVRSPR